MQAAIAMINLAGYCFNAGSVIALDLTRYTAEPPKADEPEGAVRYDRRAITLTLVGPTTHTFKLSRADVIYEWYLQLTGQKTAELIAYPDRPGQSLKENS